MDQKTFDNDMSRRDFLKFVGGSLLTATGVSSVQKYLEGSNENLGSSELIENYNSLYQNRNRSKYLDKLIEDHKEEYRDLELEVSENGSENIEERREILNNLSQFYFEKPFVKLLEYKTEDLTEENIQNWFKTGRNYSMISLRLDPVFGSNYTGDNYNHVLKKMKGDELTEEDLRSISMYAHNLIGAEISNGINIGGPRKFLNLINTTRKAMYSYKKIREIDESFMGGSASSGLATFYSFIEKVTDNVPFEDLLTGPLKKAFLYGSSTRKAKELYKDSLEHEDFLMNNVLYAAFYTRNIEEERGEEIFNNEVSKVLEKSDNEEIMEKFPLWNEVAVFLADNMEDFGYRNTGMSNFMRFS